EIADPIITDASLDGNFTNEAGVAGQIRFLKNIPGMWLLQECRRAWAQAGQEFSYSELMERAAGVNPSGAILDLDEFVTPGKLPQRICEYCRKTGQEVPSGVSAITRLILESLAARYRQTL